MDMAPFKPEEHTHSMETGARQVLQRALVAIAKVVDACEPSAIKSTRLAEELGIHKKLAWQISKVLGVSDPLEIPRYLPTRRGLEPLLKAAHLRQVAPATIDSARLALQNYEDYVRENSNDRHAFEMTVSALGSRQDDELDIRWRQAAFHGNCYTLGASAHTVFRVGLFQRPKELLECAFVWGLVDLHRIRPNVAWRVQRRALVSDDGDSIASTFRPLVQGNTSTREDSMPIWPEFCTQPTPECYCRQAWGGVVEHWLKPGKVGKPGAVTLVGAERGEVDLPQYQASTERCHNVGAVLNTPSEWVVLDQYLHEDLWGRVSPTAAVFTNLFGGDQLSPPMRQEDRLPIPVHVQRIGKGLAAGYTRHVTHYVEMMTRAFALLGWDAARFDLYRVVMQYPPIPTTVSMWHELPAAPARGGSEVGSRGPVH